MNIDLQLNVDEQQDDIKHLRQQCDIDNEDKFQEITVAITTMNKEIFCVCDM